MLCRFTEVTQLNLLTRYINEYGWVDYPVVACGNYFYNPCIMTAMARVSAAEGIRYGFGLLGYLLGVFIFGLVLTVGGFVLVRNSPTVGIIVVLLGGVSLYAGIFGTTYKVIADAVDKGNRGQRSTPTAQKTAKKQSSGTQTATKEPSGPETTTKQK
jgi:hypothetical protein